MRVVRTLALVPCVLVLAACLDPRDYESEPVTVPTAQGPVICQLYTRERVIWDRAINRPERMSVEMADSICIAEGKRQAGLN